MLVLTRDAALDDTVTIPADLLGRTLGFLGQDQERELAAALVLALDLDVPLPPAGARLPWIR